MTIDWSRPIEAVHDGGLVHPATAAATPTKVQRVWVAWHANATWSDHSGSLDPEWHGWRIRNVASVTPERDPALWDRMEALVREMALRDNGDGTVSLFKIREHVDAAMSIVADLPKPVDPDLIEAREVCFKESLSPSREDSTYLKGGLDNSLSMRCALAAIKRGRELERQGASS